MGYLLSIIVPTKNRYVYLKECIKSIMLIESKDIEVIIQDNSDDTEEIKSFVKELPANIKYYYQSGDLSQTANSELALSHATGQYICYIGDDDSISEKLIDTVKLLEKHRIKALNCQMSSYYWPDIVYKGSNSKPYLSYVEGKGNIKRLNTNKVLKKCMKNGMQDIKFLPRVYHAVIAKEVLEEVKQRSGSYFPGPSPDMANATACSIMIKEHFYTDLPLIISGSSYKSAVGMGQRGEHAGALSKVKQLADDVEEKWSSNIPKIWLGNTIWPESSIKALQALGITENKVNLFPMYARVVIKFPQYRKSVYEQLHSLKDYTRLSYYILSELGIEMKRRISNKLQKSLNGYYSNYEPISLLQAYELTNLHVNKYYKNLEENINKEMEKNV